MFDIFLEVYTSIHQLKLYLWPNTYAMISEIILGVDELEKVDTLLKTIRKLGYPIHNELYIHLLNHAIQEKQIERFLIIYRRFQNAGFYSNIAVYNTLLLMLPNDKNNFVLELNLKKQKAVFHQRSKVTEHIRSKDQLLLYDLILKICFAQQKIEFNSKLIRALINIIWKGSNYQCGKVFKLLMEIQKSGANYKTDVYVSLIILAHRKKNLKKVFQLFHQMQKIGYQPITIHEYNMFFHRTYEAIEWRDVIVLLKEMQSTEIQPNIKTYNILISIMKKKGHWKAVLYLFENAENKIKTRCKF